MAQPLEVTLRDEDIQAIITGLATHRDTLEGVANRIQVRQLENRVPKTMQVRLLANENSGLGPGHPSQCPIRLPLSPLARGELFLIPQTPSQVVFFCVSRFFLVGWRCIGCSILVFCPLSLPFPLGTNLPLICQLIGPNPQLSWNWELVVARVVPTGLGRCINTKSIPPLDRAQL